MKVAGICYSDVSAFNGTHAFRKPPIISGHEFSGEVVDVGENIRKFEIGDRVLVEPHIGCGHCFFCRHGNYNECINKRFLGTKDWDGAFSEYVIVEEPMCYLMPPKMSFEEGTLFEPYCVGLHAVRRAQVKMGDNLAILGCGTIGLTTLMSAKLSGSNNILISDISNKKRKMAIKIGADIAVDPKVDNVENISQKITDGLGFDIVFIAAPSNDVLKQAFEICRRQGKIIMIASFPKEIHFDSSKLRISERILMGTSMYTSDDYQISLKQWKKGYTNLKALITQKIKLEEAPKIISKLANHEMIDDVKTIIDFD